MCYLQMSTTLPFSIAFHTKNATKAGRESIFVGLLPVASKFIQSKLRK